MGWFAIVAFGAFHGLNPGMGWLFALSMGLQQRSTRAIVVSLVPIALGHAASVAVFALLVFAGIQFISTAALQLVTAALLICFGIWKLFNWYRHPRWVGMKVNLRDLFLWSFLMATAHGAGLMVAPAFVDVTRTPGEAVIEQPVHHHGSEHEHHTLNSVGDAEHAEHTDAEAEATDVHAGHAAHLPPGATGWVLGLAVVLHTLVMLVVMGVVALFVYKRFGLAVLRTHWINFDLIWAMALIVVGIIAGAVAVL